MSIFSNLGTIWSIVKEVDLGAIRQQALRSPELVVVGAAESRRNDLAAQLLQDPARPQGESLLSGPVLDLEEAGPSLKADLILLVMSAAQTQSPAYKDLVNGWARSNQRLVVLIDAQQESESALIASSWSSLGRRKVVIGDIQDIAFLTKTLAPAVMDLLPDQLMALGRHFPFFRVPAAQRLINETCLTNSTYSFSTGLAEMVPVLGIPVFMTDMFILTKNQAYLVYKLGLTLGLSTRWQDYLAEFGSVLGGGFVFRQIARSLIGLIPGWGILPKTAVAYSGTYVVGYAVLSWYLSGRHLTRAQMRDLYQRAFSRGKGLAGSLARKAPRPRLRRRAPVLAAVSASQPPPRLPKRSKLICAQCGKTSARDARFCQYCGAALST